MGRFVFVVSAFVCINVPSVILAPIIETNVANKLKQ
jgi:hypothetical protein